MRSAGSLAIDPAAAGLDPGTATMGDPLAAEAGGEGSVMADGMTSDKGAGGQDAHLRFLKDLISLTKPRLSTLVLVTAGGGLWLSDTPVSTFTALAAVLGTMLVVGGANALNCYLERDVDRLMARTASRPLPAGRMAPGVALAFGLALSFVSIPLLTFATTPLAGLLAAIALILYVLVYTPLKRRNSLSTLLGAIPGAMPPLIGWTAATGQLDAGGLVLFGLLCLWQIPHSLAIGIYRQQEYEKAGLVVFPTEHGIEATRRQMVLYSMPLAVLPLTLYHTNVAGLVTLATGSVFGLYLLGMCIQGLRQESGPVWARRVFLFTLAHLTTLFGALAVDQWA